MHLDDFPYNIDIKFLNIFTHSHTLADPGIYSHKVWKMPKEPLYFIKNLYKFYLCRAGTIVDSFIPIDRNTWRKRGFGFVRFKFEEKVVRAITLATRRSWGGQKICAHFIRTREEKQRPYTPIQGRCHHNAWLQPAEKSSARCEG